MAVKDATSSKDDDPKTLADSNSKPSTSESIVKAPRAVVSNIDYYSKAARSIAGNLLLLIVIGSIALALAWELARETVTLESFGVPDSINERGYAGQIIGHRLMDELATIRERATTRKNDLETDVSPDWAKPDINIPGAAISLRSIVRYARDLFGSERRITGEIIQEQGGLRLQMRGLGRRAFEPVTVNSEAEIERLLHLGARELMKQIDPYVLASFLVSEKDLDGAVDALLWCLTNDRLNDDAWAYNLWGLILEEQRQYERALHYFALAIETKNDFFVAHSNTGRVLGKLNKYDEAEANFTKAMQIEPNDSYPPIEFGDTLVAAGRIDEAIEMYKRAVNTDPTSAHAHNQWGLALSGDDKIPEAVNKFRKVVRLLPDSPVANSNLGNELRRNGSYKEAEYYLRFAVKLDGSYGSAYYNLGILFEETGELHRALHCIDIALKSLSEVYRTDAKALREEIVSDIEFLNPAQLESGGCHPENGTDDSAKPAN